jgi:hypothetical protein
MVDVPIPSSPVGGLAGQSRPKALLIKSPSGLLTPVEVGCHCGRIVGAVEESLALCAEHLHGPTERGRLVPGSGKIRWDNQRIGTGRVNGYERSLALAGVRLGRAEV